MLLPLSNSAKKRFLHPVTIYYLNLANKIPPIFLLKQNYNKIAKDLRVLATKAFVISCNTNKIRNNLTDIADFQNVTKY